MRRIFPARRGPFVVLVAGCLLALAACSGSDPSPPDATTPHPGTAVTSARPTPTSNPTDAAAAAAIAAVQNLYEAYNRMLESGSSAEYRKTFTQTCAFCLQDARGIDRIASKGQVINGGHISISGLRVAFVRTDLVVVEGDQKDSPAVVRKGSKIVERFAGGAKTHLTWRVEVVRGTWLVSDESPLQ